MHRLPLSRLKFLELGNVVFLPVGIAVCLETIRVPPGDDAARRHQGDPAILYLCQWWCRWRVIPNFHRQFAFEGLVLDFLEQHLDGALHSWAIRLLQTSDTAGEVTFSLRRTDCFIVSETHRKFGQAFQRVGHAGGGLGRRQAVDPGVSKIAISADTRILLVHCRYTGNSYIIGNGIADFDATETVTP